MKLFYSLCVNTKRMKTKRRYIVELTQAQRKGLLAILLYYEVGIDDLIQDCGYIGLNKDEKRAVRVGKEIEQMLIDNGLKTIKQ